MLSVISYQYSVILLVAMGSRPQKCMVKAAIKIIRQACGKDKYNPCGPHSDSGAYSGTIVGKVKPLPALATIHTAI